MNGEAAAETRPKRGPAYGALTAPETAAPPLNMSEEPRFSLGIGDGSRIQRKGLSGKRANFERCDDAGERKEAFHETGTPRLS